MAQSIHACLRPSHGSQLKNTFISENVNVPSQGRTYYSGGVKDEMADAIRDFNEYVRQDSRVDVLALPFRDGVTIITRRCCTLPGSTTALPRISV